jgi:hypothetical protein
MFLRGGFDAKATWRKLPRIDQAVEDLVALAGDNSDKAQVMTYIGQLVADGYADWKMLDNGEVEVRFTSGEAYLFCKTNILRLA